MRRYVLLFSILHLTLAVATAQRVSHAYDNVPLSEALLQLQAEQSAYAINFLYDELEDFRVTTTVSRRTVPDAIQQMIGFYPVRMTVRDDAREIYVECTHKTDRHLTGHIVDELGQPIAYANVALLAPHDSTLLSGGVSNESGYFAVPYELPAVLARISYVGYKTVYRLCDTEQVGTITMQPDTYTIKGVTVKGHVPTYRLTAEGIQTNVENSVLSQLGTAEDVLAHVPGIIKRQDGFEVFGKGAPLIYINGRLMRHTKELEQLKSTDVKSIELITNPGAKYNATVGAVVKIQTVRKAGDGFSVDAWGKWQQGRKDQETASLDLNYRHGALDVFASLWANKGKHLQLSEITQEVLADTLWQQRNDLRSDAVSRNCSVEGGFNYQLDEHHTFGAKYEYALPSAADETAILASSVTADGQFYDKWESRTVKQDKGNGSCKLNAYYAGSIGRLSIDWNFDYLRSGYDEQSRIEETCQIQDDRLLDAENSVRNRMFASKLAMTYPILGGSFDFGAEYVNTSRQDDYVNPQQFVSSSYSTLKEQGISPYAEYARRLPFGQLRAGLRYEHVTFDYYDNGRLVEAQSRSYGNLYPSLSFGTQLGKVLVQVAYSVKTTRPTYRQLSNDVFYGNRYTLQRGNPLLDNSTNHTLSLLGLWKSVHFTLSYSDERNAIINWMGQIGESSVTMVSYKNISSLKTLVPFVAFAPRVGIWRPQFSLGIRKQWLTLETASGSVTLDKPIVVAQTNSTFAFSNTLTGELSFRYQSPGHYQNVYLDYHQAVLNASLVKTFFNDQLSIKLAGEDLLDRSRDRNLVYNHQVKLWQGNFLDHRRFVATLRYKFNTARSKYKGTGAGNSEKDRL